MTDKAAAQLGDSHGAAQAKRKAGVVVALFLAVLAVSALVGGPAANYAGVCLNPLGVLNEEERNRQVFWHLKKKNLLTLRGVGDAIVGSVDNGFGYQTFEHFMAENSQCCSYSNNGPLNTKPYLLRRLSGKHRSFVVVRYKPIWTLKEKPADVIQQRSLVISNCGKVDDIYP
jgi:hypothetical protein